MPKNRVGRVIFAGIILAALFVIGRNAYRYYLSSALVAAVDTGNAAAVRSLLDRGADANVKKTYSNAPVSPKPGDQAVYWVEGDPTPMLRVALGKLRGASLRDDASRRNMADIVFLLLQHGARLNPNDTYSDYLRTACRYGSVDLARYTLAKGADPNVAERFESAPMEEALSLLGNAPREMSSAPYHERRTPKRSAARGNWCACCASMARVSRWNRP